jgi:hypothetical protein
MVATATEGKTRSPVGVDDDLVLMIIIMIKVAVTRALARTKGGTPFGGTLQETGSLMRLRTLQTSRICFPRSSFNAEQSIVQVGCC